MRWSVFIDSVLQQTSRKQFLKLATYKRQIFTSALRTGMEENAIPCPWTRTLDVETTEPVDGVVRGSVPSWLEGSLIRNGSGIYQVGESKYNHLFDGLSVIHKFNIKDGRITYMNKALKSEAYKKNFQANRIVVSEYGTRGVPDPCLSIFGRLMNRFSLPSPGDVTDNCSVNVCYIADSLYAMTETSLLRRIDPENLDTINGVIKLHKHVAINHATAHPHVDPDGTVYNMGNVYGPNPSYNIVSFPPGNSELGDRFPEGKIVATIPIKNSMKRGYYHSFGITDNYFVFAEISLIFNAMKFLTSNLRQTQFSESLEWDPNTKSRFHVINRTSGEREVFITEPFFTFHHINAFEKDDHVVVDLCCSDDGRLMNQLLLEKLHPTGNVHAPIPVTKPRRYVLPIKSKDAELGRNLVTLAGTVATAKKDVNGDVICDFEVIIDHTAELPRINYQRNGKPYRFFYCIASPEGTIDPTEILKVDVETKSFVAFEEKGKILSEPVFVARPGATEEDDGMVLASMLDEHDPTKVTLLVLDGKTFKEVARSDFEAKGIVPKDFHGLFISPTDAKHRY